MAKFISGETVLCERSVKNPKTGVYFTPSTSMTISILDSHNGPEIDKQDMIEDSAGKFHYNYNSSATGLKGKYCILYIATDGADIAMWEDEFTLE